MSPKVSAEPNKWRVTPDKTVQVVNPHSSTVKELYAASNYPKRNWKGICIALLIISAVSVLVTLAVFIMSLYDVGLPFKGTGLELNDIIEGKFKAQPFRGSWLSETELIYRTLDGELVVYNIKNASSQLFMTSNPFRRLNSDVYYVSPDRRYVLIEYNFKKIDRVACSQYSIFDTFTEHQFDLIPTSNPNDLVHLQYAAWIGLQNAIVMVYKNDIYLKHSVDDKESVRLTHTGQKEVIYNGVPDPTYTKYFWKERGAIWFSPDLQKLMYVTFNASEVEDLILKKYLNVIAATFYPERLEDRIKLSRPGGKITSVMVSILDLKTSTMVVVHKPVSIPEDHYITSAQWVNNNLVSISYLDRAQQRGVVALCSGSSWYCYQSYVERQNSGWVEFSQRPIFSKTGPNYLLISPLTDGENQKYRQILMVNLKSHRSVPITMETLHVDKMCGWNENTKHIFFTASPEDSSEVKHLYKVAYEVKEQLIWGSPLSIHCLTCHISLTPESDNSSNECSYAEPIMSPHMDYYILQCLGPLVPHTYLFSIDSSIPILLLHNNSQLQESVSSLSLPSVKTFQVKLSSGYKAVVKIFLPPGWLQTSTIKYPMLVQALGTTGLTSVSDKWSLHWGHYLSTQKEIIYVMMDSRGSYCCSESLKFELKHNLGKVEVDDHIEITNYLIENLKFVDPELVGIWGWGYGGYVALRALGKLDSPFKCGIPISPVTSWLFSDAAFSERYLGFPDKGNYFQNYMDNDAMTVVKSIGNKSLFLVHGTGDQEVPFHHSAFLMKSLSQAGISFQSQIYPDSDHGLDDVKGHLYDSLNNFLHICYPHWMDNSSIELRQLLYHEQEKLSNYV